MPAKKPKPDVRLGDMKEKAVVRIAELWDAHIERAMKILEEGESRVVTLNFSVALDFTESTAKEKTSIRYTQAFTDSRQDDFEDPRQGRFGFTEGGAPAGEGDETPPEGGEAPPEGSGSEAPPEGGAGGEAAPGETPPDEAAAAIGRAKKRRGRPKKAK